MQPDLTLFSAGYRNRFGHPRSEVVARYRELGSAILRSDRHGAIELEFGPGVWNLTLERERRKRYWQDAPPAD